MNTDLRATASEPPARRTSSRRATSVIDDPLVRNMGLRVNGLVALLDDMSHRPYGDSPASSDEPCDFITGQRVKVEAVRWMLQVVEHLYGATRRNALSTITRSVQILEEAMYEELQRRHMAVNTRMYKPAFGR